VQCMIARILLWAAAGTTVLAADGGSEKVRQYRVANEQRWMAEYRELVAIPNVGTDRENIRRLLAGNENRFERVMLWRRLSR